MRFNDIIQQANILNEGPLAPRDFYERQRLVNFITKLDNKEPFFTTSGEQINVPASTAEIRWLKSQLKTNFDSKDPKARSIADLDIPTVIGGIKLSSLAKTKEFGGKVGMSTSGEMDYSKANIGPTVEALKSFAIYAKLVFRDKEHITADDVIKIGKLADAHSKVEAVGKSKSPTTLAVYKKQVPDINKTVKDSIELKVALSTPSFKRAVNITQQDKSAWGNLQGIIQYINNESDIKRYGRFFQKNNKRDPLKISVVGISGAKTDISSTYKDANGVEKPIQNLSMSVKSAGAEWYDQASAGNEAGMTKFYGIIGLSEADADQALASSKFVGGGKESSNAQFAARIRAVDKVYKHTFELLKTKIPQLNDKGEAEYIHSFLKNLKNSLAGDERLVYVKFDANGTYAKLKPHLLAHLAQHINLDVNYTPMVGDSKPRIYWIDSNTGKTLLYVVLLVNAPNKRLTHQFNLGKDFFEILKSVEQKINPPTTPAVTPSATPVVTPTTTPAATPVATPAATTTKVAVTPPNVQARIPADDEKEVAEELGNKDLERIRHLSGIVSQMSKNF
jgi:hypothetical protein